MKKPANGSSTMGARAFVILALTLASGSAAAGVSNVGGTSHVRQMWPGYPVVYPTYFYPGACLSYGDCAGMWWTERRPSRRPMAPSEPAAVEQDIWGTTGSPWGYVRRIPPPTPQSQIQPRYQDASTVRPEFGGPERP